MYLKHLGQIREPIKNWVLRNSLYKEKKNSQQFFLELPKAYHVMGNKTILK